MKGFKKKNQIPNYEDVSTGVLYAVTLNPSDKFQHFNMTSRVNKTIVDLESILFYNDAEWELYPEISCKGRIHFHGYVSIRDKNNFYLYNIPYLLKRCTIVIKDIHSFEDPTYWNEYIEKQLTFHAYCNSQLIQIPIEIHK